MSTCTCPRVATIELFLPILCVHTAEANRGTPHIVLQFPNVRSGSSEAVSRNVITRLSLPKNVNICDDCFAWMQAETDGWPSSFNVPACSCTQHA